MRQWLVLLRKEILELRRSSKLLWVPLVFAALGALQPAASFYLPELIDAVGGLPGGAVIDIPIPGPGVVIAESLGQIGTIGLLVLVLAAMGAIVAERSSGAAAMLLVKPVSHGAYILAKWTAYNSLMLFSVVLGQVVAWFYTDYLIGSFPMGTMLASAVLLAVWLSFIMTVLMFASVFLKSAGAVAFITLGAAIVLSILTSLVGSAMDWSPASLSSHAVGLLTDGAATELLIPLAVTIALTAALLTGAIIAFRRSHLVA